VKLAAQLVRRLISLTTSFTDDRELRYSIEMSSTWSAQSQVLAEVHHHEADAGVTSRVWRFSAPILQRHPIVAWSPSHSGILSNIACPGADSRESTTSLLSRRSPTGVFSDVPYPTQGFSIKRRPAVRMGNFGVITGRPRGVRFAHTTRYVWPLTVRASTRGIQPFGFRSGLDNTTTTSAAMTTYSDERLPGAASRRKSCAADLIDMVPLVSLNPGALSGTARTRGEPLRAWQEDLHSSTTRQEPPTRWRCTTRT